MNENYIIEGNAVYEIDAQCRQEKYGDVILEMVRVYRKEKGLAEPEVL